MQRIWQIVRALFGFAEKADTVFWLLQIFGLVGIATGVLVWIQLHVRQNLNLSIIGAFLVAGFALLMLPV
jgi:hypothetical protein